MKAERAPTPPVGRLALRDFEAASDAPVAHAWLTDPHARFWGMGDNTPVETHDYFARIAASRTHQAWLGSHDGVPTFLAECYDPAADVIGDFYAVAAGDIGMHILIAPPTTRRRGFTWAVFSFVVDTIFAQTTAKRIVVEPDINNTGIHRLNARAGFVAEREIDTGEKTALFSYLTRARHAQWHPSGDPS